MKKPVASITLLAFAAIIFLTASCSNSRDKNGTKTGREREIPVTVAAAVLKDVPIEIKTFGNVKAHSSVSVKAEIDGVLTKIHFRKGQNISKGDLLFSIDSRSYKAALDQAKANLVRDRALEENALVNASRSKELYKRGLISRSDNDKAQADAASLSAVSQADQAAIANARLQVERCSIRSPIDGRAGDLLVSEGALIKANDVTMVTINQIHPIEVFFSIPQTDLATVRNRMARETLKVRAGLPKGNTPPEEGDLFFVDNTIEKGTGTVQLAGIFSNDRELLWPGQYVSVALTIAVRKNALVVPSVAVQTGQEGKFVFVAKSDNTVEVRPVEVHASAGSETVIEKGLQAGERVVTDGQLGLAPGSKIKIKTSTGVPPGMSGGRS
ncbi:MAG: Multidrug resistance protein MdtA precursor [Syntrophus sp. PtaB.Bin001]|nr:MAG: Multidrug resistance protein MdtA precursor [Syntrophus sp. PtaB.Bin001]